METPKLVTRFRYFSEEEWKRRFNTVKEKIKERELDAIMITSTENIFYLTGYHTTGYYYFQTFVIPLEGEPFLLTRYLEKKGAIHQSWIKKITSFYDTEDPIEQLSHRLMELDEDNRKKGLRPISKLGFEKQSALFPATYQEQINTKLPTVEFIDMWGLVEEVRVTKSEEEIEVIKLAAKATKAGMKGGVKAITVGCKDNDIAAEIYYATFKAGGEYPACPSFVAVSNDIGHQTWDGAEVKEGDLIFLEISGCKYRYHAPMMRTCFVGKELTPQMMEAEKLLQTCLQSCMEEMRPGVSIREIDTLSKKILNSNTFGTRYVNRLGYSIGCAFAPGWGEDTVAEISGKEDRDFQKGMVFHLIPFLLIPELGSVGISETVVITEDGAESVFGDFPKKFFLINSEKNKTIN